MARRCTGSARFGIAPHQAPAADFPVQKSRKDGLGTMCRPHWTAYVKALKEARSAPSEAPAPKPRAAMPDIAAAEALITEVDRLSGPEHLRRIGDMDVQAALELLATVNRTHADIDVSDAA